MLKIRRNIGLTVFRLTCSVIILGCYSLMPSQVLYLFMGLLFLGTAIVRLVSPAMVVHFNRIELKNGFGMTMRERNFPSLHFLHLDGKKLFVFENGEWKRFAVLSPIVFQPGDVEQLRAWIDQVKMSTPQQQGQFQPVFQNNF